MSENKITGKKIIGLAGKGFKKAMSASVGGDVYVTKRIKARSYDLYTNIRDFGIILWNTALIIGYVAIGFFRLVKDFPRAFRRASQNNFRLGLTDLKAGNLIDARIRFLLSNMFYSKSATTKYYIAYVYYLQGNYTKSLKYLKKSIDIDANDNRSQVLLIEIEKALSKKMDEADFQNTNKDNETKMGGGDV